MCRSRIVLTALVFLVACAAPAVADRVVLQNGRALECQVVAEDESGVTIKLEIGSSTLTQHYKKDQVRSVVRVAQVRPTYVTLPVIGAIGQDVTAAALRAGFAEARAAGARCVVLAVDSPGGEVREMAGMIDAIIEASKDLRVVALVKSAHSAAAVVAMTCPRVYMTPEATIGATVPFRITQSGPEEVDAKMRSIIQATMRAATASGGHADLLIRGMSEIDLEIYLTTDWYGSPLLRTSGPGRLIKSKGQILTLTSDEAMECGLATRAANLADVGAHEAPGGEWNEGPRRPWQVVVGHVALAKWRVEQRYADLRARYVEAGAALSALSESHAADVARINAEYQHAMRVAQYQRNPQAAASRAVAARDARYDEARQGFQASLAQLQAQRDAAAMEAGELLARHPGLLTHAERD